MKLKLFGLVTSLFLGTASVAGAANLVTNGDFEAGNTGFTSGYTYVPLPGTNACCGGLWPEATYGVGGNANSYHALFDGLPESGSNFMIVNGAGTAGVTVWEQTGIAVLANTTYYFGAYVSSVHPASPAVLAFSINGTQIGGTISPSSTVGVWSLFYEPWFSGAATTADISLVNQNTAFGGNDFGLDTISFDVVAPIEVPAPGALGLFGLAVLALGRFTRRRRA
jgi:MYXO-CTERM domain-containing protein